MISAFVLKYTKQTIRLYAERDTTRFVLTRKTSDRYRHRDTPLLNYLHRGQCFNFLNHQSSLKSLFIRLRLP